jgi:hypothetical protein
MPAEQPLPRQVRKFVCFHLHDKNAFAPFTGQDYSAWHAFVYAVQLYGRGDAGGQQGALDVMRVLALVAQRKTDVLACFKKAIPGVLDWDFEHTLWTKVAPEVALTDIERDFIGSVAASGKRIIWPCADGARVCAHLRSKPHASRPGWYVCKDPLCKTVWKLDDDGGSAVCPL